MVRTRRRLVPALGALTLAAGLGLVGAGPALAGGPGQGQGPGSGGGPGECRLAGSTLTFTGAPERDLTETFTTYADTAGEWTGADSTYSIPLKGNTILWVFSDTFLGEVAEDGSRPLDSPFLNNSFVMQDRRGELSTITGPDDTSLIPQPTDEPQGWYWVGDGLQTPRGDVQVVALRYWYGGGGLWDFGFDSNHLATFDRTTLQLTSLTSLPSETGVQWGSYVAEESTGRYTYVYGVDDQGLVKSMHVARVHGRDLTNHWELPADHAGHERDLQPQHPRLHLVLADRAVPARRPRLRDARGGCVRQLRQPEHLRLQRPRAPGAAHPRHPLGDVQRQQLRQRRAVRGRLDLPAALRRGGGRRRDPASRPPLWPPARLAPSPRSARCEPGGEGNGPGGTVWVTVSQHRVGRVARSSDLVIRSLA